MYKRNGSKIYLDVRGKFKVKRFRYFKYVILVLLLSSLAFASENSEAINKLQMNTDEQRDIINKLQMNTDEQRDIINQLQLPSKGGVLISFIYWTAVIINGIWVIIIYFTIMNKRKGYYR